MFFDFHLIIFYNDLLNLINQYQVYLYLYIVYFFFSYLFKFDFDFRVS